MLPKAEPAEHASHLCLERVAIAGAELAVEAMVAVRDFGIGGALRINLRHALREGFQLFFHGEQAREHLHAFFKDGAAGEGEAILGKVAGADAPGGGQRSIIQGFDSGKDLEQGGFPSAVCAHNSGAITRSDQPVELLKEQLGPESLAGGRELDHGE